MNIRHFDITKISVLFQYATILHAVMLLLCSRVPDNLSMQGVYKEFQCQVNFHLALQITITKFSSNLTCNVTVPVGFLPETPSLLHRGLFRAALTVKVSWPWVWGRGKKRQRAGNAGKGKESSCKLYKLHKFPVHTPKLNIIKNFP